MPFKQALDDAVRAADPSVWRGGGEVMREMAGSCFDVGDHLALGADGQTLVGHGADGRKEVLSVYDIVGGTVTRLLRGHQGSIQSVAVQGDLIMSGDGTGAILLWSLSSGANTGQLMSAGGRAHKREVFGLAVEGDLLVSGSHDNTIKLWSLASKENTATLRASGGVNSVALTGDGAVVSGGQDRVAKVWLLSGGATEPTHTWQHPGKVYSVAAAGDVVATGCMDGGVRTFSRAMNARTREFTEHRSWCNTVRLLGPLLVSGSTDATVKVWSLATPQGELITSLDAHTHMVLGLAVSHTNGCIASLGQDGKVFVWKPSAPPAA